MFARSYFLIAAFLASAVSSTPITLRDNDAITLPFAVSLNLSGVTLAEMDQQRAAHMIERGQLMWTHELNGTLSDLPVEFSKRATSIGVTNTAVTYTANVNVGSPATSYTLLIDTGSSLTWVGAHKAYKATNTSHNTGMKVSSTYGLGSFSGTEYTDTVSLSSGLTITNQSIGVASTSQGFQTVDGILGIGPVALTYGNVVGMTTVPTVSDNLKTQGKISTEVVGISYSPTNKYTNANGELTFGGVDTSKYTGTLSYFSITKTSPAKYYWGIDQSITYGSSTVLSSTAGIVDTGTTLVLLASDAFSRYQNLTGGTMDSATGLLKINQTQFNNLQTLNFNVGGQKYAMTPNAQIWPRALNTYIGGTSGSIYLIVGNLGTKSGSGLDFINGYTFLERFYSVYDTTNNRIGLATTSNTQSIIN